MTPQDFMIQGGDPTATGRGGTSIYGPAFEDEITHELKHTGAGIVSFLLPHHTVNSCDRASNISWKCQILCYLVLWEYFFHSTQLAMANSGPNTNASQFYVTLGTHANWISIFFALCGSQPSSSSALLLTVTLAPTPWLDGKNTIFGRVYSGMHVIKRMGLAQTDPADRPIEDIRIVRSSVYGQTTTAN